MSNKITLKKSSVADKVPLTGDLEYGELALNYADGNLFYKNSSNAITTLASNKFVSVTGNITGGNVLTGGNLYVGTGNAGYVYGNAYYMTGVSAASTGNIISNGTSNVWVNTSNGNVTVAAGGISNVAVFGPGSLTLSGAIGTPKNITKNVVIADGINAMLIGPLTFDAGVSMTVPTTSTVYFF